MVATNETVLHALMKKLFFAEINNAYDSVGAATGRTIVATEATKRAAQSVKLASLPAATEKLALASMTYVTALMTAETAWTNTAVCLLTTSFELHSCYKYWQY
jgi:hypothetical protein